MPLTVKKVEREAKPGRYGDGHGLYLQITKTGSKSWVLRYERGGKESMMGLGPLHAFDLDEARERARLARKKLADGVDPLSANRAERSARALEAARQITFRDASQRYFDQNRRKWTNAKHAAQFLSTLAAYAHPIIGNVPVGDITTNEVLRVIEPIWYEKTETASRVRSRIEGVLAWATVRGFRTGDNPARWSGHLREALPARNAVARVRHHPAMPYAEVPAFMKALRDREGIAARALELAILTASRTSEVTGARWSEFDLSNGVWCVPATRMKAGKEHRVPLSACAETTLRSLPRESEFVFPGTRKGKGISNMSMAAVLKRMNVQPSRATVHGFRSSFRDWAAERTSYPNEVVEMALAHTVKNKVEAAYRRGDLLEKRQSLMVAWAEYTSTAGVHADPGD